MPVISSSSCVHSGSGRQTWPEESSLPELTTQLPLPPTTVAMARVDAFPLARQIHPTRRWLCRYEQPVRRASNIEASRRIVYHTFIDNDGLERPGWHPLRRLSNMPAHILQSGDCWQRKADTISTSGSDTARFVDRTI